ncbi:MAG: GNAT family N-acetyltransferase [Burkholderiaceae bacterium]
MSSPNPSPPLAGPGRFTLRAAEPSDLNAIVGLIGELAAFESLTHQLQVTPEKLAPHLFGPKPVAEALVVDVVDAADAGSGATRARGATVVAFALFFTHFSTFLAQPGLYLEDLYVQPTHRGRGIGKALLTRLAQTALERGCGRFEWSVLDWNEPAIRFYRGMGATVMPDWRICRVSGEALAQWGAPQG